jgi:hypothetical protein
MNSVVINVRFGGFGLSEVAAAALVARGSTEVEVDVYDIGTEYEWTCVSWNGSRHDSDLVAVVRELGESAWGEHAELVIIDIEGSQYRITEYDGLEGLETPESISWTSI